MIYSVRGTVIHMEAGCAVIECGGVGYKCQTTINTLKKIKLNSEAMLYTYMNVRDDAVELFGFSSTSELSTFKMLISVSGVGPKAGLAILSELTPEQVAVAVASGDSKTITRAQGVGNKLAQRVILELKDKLKGVAASQEEFSVSESSSPVFAGGNITNAVAALAVLGYSSAEVMPILSRLDGSKTVEQLIGETLKELGKQK
ncbi:MAG: Holliday junction branch migration protein RuvA [Anaeromassilibacillus sp.]|nr:Holliday junction branch migration protein RuvA [Anaeromassilibacillus sp.]MDY3778679.1 Holliday junction branch migration protein RuvA [Candidatus Limousia pullorum]